MKSIDEILKLTDRPFTIYRATGRTQHTAPHWVFRINDTSEWGRTTSRVLADCEDFEELILKAVESLKNENSINR